MAFSGTGKVWMNGKIVDWKDATIHIAAHVVHYGTGVFEGMRCYKTPSGSAFFRLSHSMLSLLLVLIPSEEALARGRILLRVARIARQVGEQDAALAYFRSTEELGH